MRGGAGSVKRSGRRRGRAQDGRRPRGAWRGCFSTGLRARPSPRPSSPCQGAPMPKPVTAARVLLGLLLIAFGADWFYHFLPISGESTPRGEAFLNALVETGYLFTLIKSIEIAAGALLLTGLRPQLGAALFA